MKKSAKKIIAYAMALSCLTSISSFGASAGFNPDDIGSLPEYMQDSELVYSSDARNNYGEAKYVYHGSKGYHIVSLAPDCMNITVKAELGRVKGYAGLYATENEEITAIIQSYMPESVDFDEKFPYNTIDENGISHPTFTYTINTSTNPGILSHIKEIKEKISEITEIESFKLSKDFSTFENAYIMSNSGNVTDYLWITPETVDEVRKYVEDNNLDFTVNAYEQGSDNDGSERYRCYVEPGENVSLQEQFLVAEKLQENFGLTMPLLCSFNCVVDEAEETDLIEEIDVLNSIDGDANEDGKTNIADAAFIMQAVGNKDKYRLSAQGEFNADSDGNGLTALDALAIQKKIAGIE